MADWTLRETVREGISSWRFGRWRTVGLHAMILVAVALPLAADLRQVDDLLAKEQRWLHDGG
ncbi:MAG: hypothetical protein ACRCYU_15675, partial [Nocardioides sp.]